MSASANKIEAFLRNANVDLPSQPTDYWPSIKAKGVDRLYVISMTGRTGSTWLAYCLDQIPGLGFPKEYFSEEGLPHYWKYDQPQALSEVISGICAKHSDEGVFGFKINPTRLFQLGRFVSLEETFSKNHCLWIDMRRLNIIKQAFSFFRARRTGRWHNLKGSKAIETFTPALTDEQLDSAIWQEVRSILRQELQVEEFYSKNKIEPLRIFFEELSDSKPQLLLRVASEVRSKVEAHHVIRVEERTERLATKDDEAQELAFLLRNVNTVNKVVSNRSTLGLEDIKSIL